AVRPRRAAAWGPEGGPDGWPGGGAVGGDGAVRRRSWLRHARNCTGGVGSSFGHRDGPGTGAWELVAGAVTTGGPAGALGAHGTGRCDESAPPAAGAGLWERAVGRRDGTASLSVPGSWERAASTIDDTDGRQPWPTSL